MSAWVIEESGEIQAAISELYCRFNVSKDGVERLCSVPMKGSTPGNLKTHVQRHHIGKGASTPFFLESRRGTHSAQEVQEAIEFYTAVMETHAALEAGEEDPHSNSVVSTPSKRREFVPGDKPGETHRPRAPRKPNGEYNIAEIKRIWKLDHTGVKCPFHKGKKNGKCPDMTCGDCEMAELFTESETETDNEEA